MADQLTEEIIGAAIEVHKILGPGLLESIYEQALLHELNLRGIEAAREVKVDVQYKDVAIKGQVIDLLVAGEVVLELKAVLKPSRSCCRPGAFLPEGDGSETRAVNQFQ